jgi:hypothetical protein
MATSPTRHHQYNNKHGANLREGAAAGAAAAAAALPRLCDSAVPFLASNVAMALRTTPLDVVAAAASNDDDDDVGAPDRLADMPP